MICQYVEEGYQYDQTPSRTSTDWSPSLCQEQRQAFRTQVLPMYVKGMPADLLGEQRPKRPINWPRIASRPSSKRKGQEHTNIHPRGGLHNRGEGVRCNTVFSGIFRYAAARICTCSWRSEPSAMNTAAARMLANVMDLERSTLLERELVYSSPLCLCSGVQPL